MELQIDTLHRIAYATDASAYREMPLAVAYPSCEEDVVSLVHQAREMHTHLIPRAGGTSVAGQVVGSGIVVDVSRHMNRILEINAQEGWARVQPGVIRDELNAALKPHGLFFSPETSTTNRCCIGGMVGNNSCGTHSLVYGATRDHVLELRCVLSDGTALNLKDLSDAKDLKDLPSRIHAQLLSLHDNHSDLIHSAFPDPSLRRRSCGYALDEYIDTLDPCKLLSGSEGTLAFITEIKVSLDPLPSPRKLALCCHFSSLDAAILGNLTALNYHPVAVELMDGKILELSRGSDKFFISGEPAALLIVEFNGPERESQAAACEQALKDSCYAFTRVYDADIQKVWSLRKAGLGVLSGMKGDAKPIGVIEDTAVAPARLPEYLREFRQMTDRLGLSCVYYGHISTGELHLRPILNIKTSEGRRLFRQVAEETARHVRKHRGSLSGEHGDGRLRGEFIPLMYGPEVYELMRQVKQTWDPDGIFNMGKIIDTPPMDEGLRFEENQPYAIENTQTYFNWRAAFDECKVEGCSGVRSQVHALMCSIEQCNGAGDCRKTNLAGGTLCPAYRVSGDETRTTRARANILRELLTRGGDWNAPEINEVLSSCLACKGCRSECPSSVDMTRIRAEVLQQKYDRHGTPLRTYLVARMAQIERLGMLVRPLYNLMATWRPTASLIKRLVGFAPQRSLPTLHRVNLALSHQPQPRTVCLFLDEFTRYHEPQLARTFITLLNRLGYRVVIPKHVESGRAAISKGCLRLARKYATENVRLLSSLVTPDTPLVGIEPSCVLSFRDEYPDLVPLVMRSDAKLLARSTFLFDEFLTREMAAGRITPAAFQQVQPEIWLHGHCHQKALVGVEHTVKVFSLLGATVHVIPSGCCGMAGSFGYEKEHFETSMQIGEMVLFPAVRQAMAQPLPTKWVAAPGTSCRQHIQDGTGIQAHHPIEILYQYLS